MSVYVDPPIWRFRNMLMCHMTADTHNELVAMADAIGVSRKWIQYPGTWREHFDICKSKRELAIRHGAIELTTRESAERIAARRAAQTPSEHTARARPDGNHVNVPVGGGLAARAADRHTAHKE